VSTTPTTPPQRSAAEIRADIEQARGQLSGSLDALRGRVNELTDWRGQLQKHRGELIVGAAVAGFVIGGLIALRRRG
jgi:Protein of unknown function (DUF3618)